MICRLMENQRCHMAETYRLQCRVTNVGHVNKIVLICQKRWCTFWPPAFSVPSAAFSGSCADILPARHHSG